MTIKNIMGTYISNEGLLWRGVLKGLPKSTNQLQSIFEAFTNSLEAINMRTKKGEAFNPYIKLNLYFNVNINQEKDGLARICLEDNGIGFDDANFKRLKTFKDDTKGYNNRGSGRIQLIHTFRTAMYESVYNQNNERRFRKFTLSKSDLFLSQNSIIYLEEERTEEVLDVYTKLSLCDLIVPSDISFFNSLEIKELKKILLEHYMLYFCVHKNNLPNITINYYHIENNIATCSISAEDIPETSHDDETINVPISHMSSDMKRVEASDETVPINIKSYKLPVGQFTKNEVKVTCKEELVDSVKIKLDCLPADMQIDSSYFLFLLSSPYFDENIGDNRNVLEFLSKRDFKKKAKQYGAIVPQIVLDDLEKQVSNKVSEMYSEIASQKEMHNKKLEELKNLYLLSDEALAETGINDSVEDILKKAYIYDAKLIAERDAVYHQKQEELKKLDSSSPTYRSDLQKLVDDMTKSIPLQDKETLSRYVTHRKFVLDLMEKILDGGLDVQNESKRNQDEKLLHNLLFTQHTDNPSDSDLWMLNEDYLYFKGCSERPLNQVEVDGKKLFKENVTEEEEKYLISLGEDRRKKRPDILLFPAERKCIIVELKTLDTNLSLHLDQIKKYAYLIRNFTNDDFTIDQFYGYLIGEALEYRDVRAVDADFVYDPKFNYMFRPYVRIANDNIINGNQDGSLYMEILTYSVILERAKLRNEAFTSKLFPKTTNIE